MNFQLLQANGNVSAMSSPLNMFGVSEPSPSLPSHTQKKIIKDYRTKKVTFSVPHVGIDHLNFDRCNSTRGLLKHMETNFGLVFLVKDVYQRLKRLPIKGK